MSDQKTPYKINIEVETAYLTAESQPQENQYVFAYTITIINTGTIAAKLLSRHWLIINAEEKTCEVEGEGVVGEQPRIEPGSSYQYTSGTVLDTPVGTMQGSYQMIADDGQQFEATIMPFSLAAPGMLH